MSVAAMSKIWVNYPGTGGSELLVLLALADWCDDRGRCWPSMASIAAKARVSRSQAQRIVHGLIKAGFLRVIGNHDGGRPGATRQYQVNFDALTGRTDAPPANATKAADTGGAHATPTGRTHATGSAHATGRTDAADGSHPCGETGRTHATQTVIEPLRTISRGESARGARLPATWELPEAWRSWAATERPDLDIDLTASKFRDHWIAKPGKDGCKSDWLATWRNWVRGEKSPAHAAPTFRERDHQAMAHRMAQYAPNAAAWPRNTSKYAGAAKAIFAGVDL